MFLIGDGTSRLHRCEKDEEQGEQSARGAAAAHANTIQTNKQGRRETDRQTDTPESDDARAGMHVYAALTMLAC